MVHICGRLVGRTIPIILNGSLDQEKRKKTFYLTTHSAHFLFRVILRQTKKKEEKKEEKKQQQQQQQHQQQQQQQQHTHTHTPLCD